MTILLGSPPCLLVGFGSPVTNTSGVCSLTESDHNVLRLGWKGYFLFEWCWLVKQYYCCCCWTVQVWPTLLSEVTALDLVNLIYLTSSALLSCCSDTGIDTMVSAFKCDIRKDEVTTAHLIERKTRLVHFFPSCCRLPVFANHVSTTFVIFVTIT